MFRFLPQLSRHLIQGWRWRVGPKLAPLLSVVWLIGLTAAGLSLWLFAHITEEVMEQETRTFDQTVLLALRQIHTPLLDRLALTVTNLGDPTVLLYLSLFISLFLLLQRRWTEAITLVIAVSGAIGLNIWLKTLFARTRPELWERSVDVKYYSFPSGHAMVSLVVYGLLGYWLAARFPARRSLLMIGTVLLIITIGLTRLYLGVHWPTDVIAGYAAGLVWLVTCILSLEMIWKHRASSRFTLMRTGRSLTRRL